MQRRQKIFIVVLICVAIIVAGLQWQILYMGRWVAQDKAVANDLRTIKTAIDQYYTRNTELPSDIAKLDLDSQVKSRTSAYTYKHEEDDATTYQLCATFKTSSRSANLLPVQEDASYTRPSIGPYVDFENHDKGHYCFTISVGYDWGVDQPVGSETEEPPTKTDDAVIKTDLAAIAAELETYYDENESYPTQAQLYDTGWRKSNLPRLSDTNISDAEGVRLGKTYIYTTEPKDCKNETDAYCESFALEAKLSSGSMHRVSSGD